MILKWKNENGNLFIQEKEKMKKLELYQQMENKHGE